MANNVYYILHDDKDLRDLFLEVRKHPKEPCFIDTETYGPLREWTKKPIVDDMTACLAGVSMTFRGQDFYFPVNHTESSLVNEDIFKKFLTHLFQLNNRIGMHNALYDLRVFFNYLGFYPKPKYFVDTMVLAGLTCQGIPFYSSGEESFKYGLKDLALYHLDEHMASYEETTGGRKVWVSGVTEEERAREELAFILGVLRSKGFTDREAIELSNRASGASDKKKATVEKLKGIMALKHLTEYVDGSRLADALLHCTNEEIAGVMKFVKNIRSRQVWRDIQMHELTAEQTAPYATHDSRCTALLYKKFAPILSAMGYVRAHDEVDVPFLYLLREMMDAGMRIDPADVHASAERLSPRIKDLSDKWTELTGARITSNKESADAVFNKLKAWPTDGAPRTPGGELQISKHALSWALQQCPDGTLGRELALIKKEHSRLYKQYTTYTESLVSQLPYRPDGRVRTNFDPNGASTGRLSSSGPNIQNITKPDDDGGMPNIRKAFKADPGNMLCVGDFSGLEVRVMAHYSQDPLLLKAILEGVDMHTLNSEKFGCKRSIAKAAYFAWFYGARAKKLASTLFISKEEAEKIIIGLDTQFPGVVAFREYAAKECRRTGYAETLFGRRRYIANILSSNTVDRFRAERQAGNTAIQGTAADIAKIAGIKLRREFDKAGILAKVIAQVHDEYVVETPSEFAPEVCKIMSHVMATCVKLSVPLGSEVKFGPTWADAK